MGSPAQSDSPISINMHGIQLGPICNSHVKSQHCSIFEDDAISMDTYFNSQFCSKRTSDNICVAAPVTAQTSCLDSSVEAGRRNGCLRDPTAREPKLQPHKRHVVRILGPLPKVSRALGATVRMPPRRGERWERIKTGPAYIDSIFQATSSQ